MPLFGFVTLQFRCGMSNNKLRRLPDSAAGTAPLPRDRRLPAADKLSNKSSTFRNEVLLASRKNGVIHLPDDQRAHGPLPPGGGLHT